MKSSVSKYKHIRIIKILNADFQISALKWKKIENQLLYIVVILIYNSTIEFYDYKFIIF
jgi:phosphoribosylformylglycinamidine (FGAM) synthase PurS component